MVRLVFITLFLFLVKCQSSSFSDDFSSERYEISNQIVERARIPEMVFQEELQPYFFDFVEKEKNDGRGIGFFASLKQLKFVPSFKDKNIIASCHSYQLLKQDNVEDNLLNLSTGWIELKLLESEYSPEHVKDKAQLKNRIERVLRKCFRQHEEIVGVVF